MFFWNSLVRRGGGEEIPLVQGKEQWLRLAEAAVKRKPHVQGKRNPSKMVASSWWISRELMYE